MGTLQWTAKKSDGLIYTSSEIGRLNLEARTRRESEAVSAISNSLSLPLRVVGDYLDRNKASSFSISWSIRSVAVEYENVGGKGTETFTLQNLYDYGVRMYLRRVRPGRAGPYLEKGF